MSKRISYSENKQCRWCGSDLINDYEIKAKLCEPCLLDFEDSIIDDLDYEDDYREREDYQLMKHLLLIVFGGILLFVWGMYDVFADFPAFWATFSGTEKAIAIAGTVVVGGSALTGKY